MKKAGPISLLFLMGLLVAGIAIYTYFSGFNRIVTERFEGRLWELPARVYARPLVLYPGLSLSPDTLAQELGLMTYQEVLQTQNLDIPGKYIRDGRNFTLFCKPFDFGDKKSLSYRLGIEFKANKILRLINLDSSIELDLVQLDPVLVGSFYPASKEDRIIMDIKETPDLLPRTLICVEDKTFYNHYGVEPRAIFRALWVNIKNREMTQGASTITQQLARNFFLTRERTLTRKVNEIFMAVALELNYDKEEILEAYVNEVYLGQDGDRAIHGFGLAAVFYFGTSLRDARPHEIALLVGMLKGPSQYNPWRYPDRAINRRNRVLKIMGEQHLISATQLEKELAEPLGVIKYPTQMNSPFPDYMELVKRQLLKEYREADVTSMGLRIFTALDPEIQIAAGKAVQTQLKKIAAQRGLLEEKLEASVIITATGSNEIQALVGGKNPYDNGFNRAMDARRPIGSLIKPVVYLTALSRPGTYTLITRVDDGPVTIKLTNGNDWIPKNFDRQSHGQVPLYIALINSYNASTVRIGMDVGLKSVGETLQKLGFNKQIPLYPSSLLGSMEMSPLEVAQIYQTFAAGGFYSPARSIRAIYTSKGELLQGYPLTIEQRLEPGAVFLLNKMLQAVVLEGTAKSLKKLLPEDLGVAGKTGSTNDLKDSWFAGFTGNRLTVVWVGRDDNKSCNLTGSAGAMQIFGYLMNLIPNQPLNLVVPENVEWAIIDTNTGLRTDETFLGALSIPFIKGSAPKHLGSYGPQAVPAQAHGKSKNDWNIINWLKTLIK